MAIRVRVQNDLQIIVPVRIERAVSPSPPLPDAPDPDDRGWVRNAAAGLNTNAKVRGALVGMTVGDTVRLRVTREDIDAGVPLFVTATGGQVEIDPGSHGPLPASGIFKVKAVAATGSATTIQVRLGLVTGPIICECDAHVFSPKTLIVTPHICTIHHAANAAAGTGVVPTMDGAAINAANITSIFKVASAIWRPAGVRFNVGAVRQEVLTNFAQDNVAAPGERDLVLSQHPLAHTCNMYFLHTMGGGSPGFVVLGLGIRQETQASNGLFHSGILIGVMNRSSAGNDLVHELGNDVAHEIGHFLTLSHVNLVNGNGEGNTYSRRQLMHPMNLLPSAVTPLTATSVPRFNDIGYGVGGGGGGHRGCLLTLKDHPKHQTDGEVMAARNRLNAANLYT
ncbi:MAG: hypothetical protein WB952_15370 [Terriglobales bacterium]